MQRKQSKNWKDLKKEHKSSKNLKVVFTKTEGPRDTDTKMETEDESVNRRWFSQC